ncbi:hypothetical protein C0993_004279, partial [Termitomyces sp. T159_Od127]
DMKLISDTLSTVIANPPSQIAIDIRVHITASNAESDQQSNDLKNGDQEKNIGYTTCDDIDLPSVAIANGRPDLARLVEEETAKAIGTISFNGRISSSFLLQELAHPLE